MKEVSSNFDQAKQQYFFRLAREVFSPVMWLLRQEGIRRGPDNQDWRNVGRHSLVVVARVRELGILLGLPESVRRQFETAAALHDFDKKAEVIAVQKNGATLQTYTDLAQQQRQKLEEAQIDPVIQNMMEGAGVLSFALMDGLVQKDFSHWTLTELSQAILHLVDDYTIEDKWVQPQTGNRNDLDRRSIRQAEKPANAQLDEDVEKSGIFPGETLHEAQRRIGHLLEQLLVTEIQRRQRIDLEPLELETYIDQKIRERIQ